MIGFSPSRQLEAEIEKYDIPQENLATLRSAFLEYDRNWECALEFARSRGIPSRLAKSFLREYDEYLSAANLQSIGSEK